jgi:hypothetical protein
MTTNEMLARCCARLARRCEAIATDRDETLECLDAAMDKKDSAEVALALAEKKLADMTAQRDAAQERAANAAVEIAALTVDRDKVKKALEIQTAKVNRISADCGRAVAETSKMRDETKSALAAARVKIDTLEAAARVANQADVAAMGRLQEKLAEAQQRADAVAAAHGKTMERLHQVEQERDTLKAVSRLANRNNDSAMARVQAQRDAALAKLTEAERDRDAAQERSANAAVEIAALKAERDKAHAFRKEVDRLREMAEASERACYAKLAEADRLLTEIAKDCYKARVERDDALAKLAEAERRLTAYSKYDGCLFTIDDLKAVEAQRDAEKARADALQTTEAEIRHLRNEVERLTAVLNAERELHGRQLAAISVAALSNTRDCAKRMAFERDNECWTAAYGDTRTAVEREMEARNEVERLQVAIGKEHTDNERLRGIIVRALDRLSDILCGPDDKCRIDGSPADRAIVDDALRELREADAPPAPQPKEVAP